MGATLKDVEAAARWMLRGATTGTRLVTDATETGASLRWVTADGRDVVTLTTVPRERVVPAVVAPVDRKQLALFGAPTEPAAPDVAPVEVRPAVLDQAYGDALPVDVDPLVELVGPEGWDDLGLVDVLDAQTAALWTERKDGRFRTVLPASVASKVEDILAAGPVPTERCEPTAPTHLLRVGDLIGHRETWGKKTGVAEVLGFTRGTDDVVAGAVLLIDGKERLAFCDGAALEKGTLSLRLAERWGAEAGDDGYWRAAPAPSVPSKHSPTRPETPVRKPSKSAPGTSAKKTPHRAAAVAEADALAQFGVTVAAALQPDGHWKVWGCNPPKPREKLLVSTEWKKVWQAPRKHDMRVRLYNRAGRCTHDSLDGDIGGGDE